MVKGKVVGVKLPANFYTRKVESRSMFSRAAQYAYNLLHNTRGELELTVTRQDSRRGVITVRSPGDKFSNIGFVRYDIRPTDLFGRDKPSLNFHSLKVLPEYRQEGIFGQMYAEMEQLAKEADAGSLQLEVEQSNLPAVKIYKKYGFTTVRTTTINNQPVFIMAKNI
jgi:ribosomal protein S18 acetylase RimI-like enzyme